MVDLFFKKGKIVPLKNCIRITVPNRLHMFTSRAAFNIEGKTGGAGISIKSGQIMEVCLSDAANDVNPLLFEYFCNIFKKMFEYDGFFQVHYENALTPHVGLGTTISQTIALCWAINDLFGRPLSDCELRKLLLDEYQEIDGNHLIRGLGTGVGAACSLYGGINFVTNSRSFTHLEPSKELAVLTFIPSEEHFQKRIELEEENGQKNLSFQADEESLLERYSLIYQKFIPALMAEDWDVLGKTIAEIHTMGVKKMECSRFDYDYEIWLIQMLLKEGAFLAGLSSLGPMNYVVANQNEINRFKSLLINNGIASEIHTFDLCRHGIEILQEN